VCASSYLTTSAETAEKGDFFWPGLPDGLFSNPKSQFGKFLEGLALEKMDIFPFGIYYGHLG
jgi:hypothetical protein